MESEGAPPPPQEDERVDPPQNNAETEKSNPLVEQARTVAGRLLDKRVTEVVQGVREGSLSMDADSVFHISTIHALRSEFPEGSYVTDKKPNGKNFRDLPVQTENGPITVQFLTAGRDENGQRIYTCKATDSEGNPLDPDPDLTSEQLVTAHIAREATSMAENFENPVQRELFTWYATGGDSNPPESAAELIKRETDPAYNAAQIIQENLNLLRREINNAPEGTDLNNQNRLIAQLETAQILAGSGFENLATVGALQSLGKDRVPELDELVAAFQPGMLEEYNKLEPVLLKAGLNDQQMEIIKTQGLNLLGPDGADIIQKLGGMEGLEKFLPEGVTPEQLMTKLEATLTPTQKEWWDTNKDKLGTGAWTALLILLAVPVIAMGAAVAAVGTAAGAK